MITIFGAGGHCRSLIELLHEEHNGISVFDDSFNGNREHISRDVYLISKIVNFNNDSSVVLAIGDNKKREEFFKQYRAFLYLPVLAHKTAHISDTARLGSANQVFGMAFINACVVIGDNNIINSGAILEHEVHVGSHNHVSVGSILLGRSSIQDRCFIGAGAVVRDGIKLCSDVIVGANSFVNRDIIEPGTYVGSPVRKII